MSEPPFLHALSAGAACVNYLTCIQSWASSTEGHVKSETTNSCCTAAISLLAGAMRESGQTQYQEFSAIQSKLVMSTAMFSSAFNIICECDKCGDPLPVACVNRSYKSLMIEVSVGL